MIDRVNRVDRGKVGLGIVIAIAFVLRLAWWVSVVSVIENEGAEYARLAQNLFSSNGYVGLFDGNNIVFPPLYPVLIGFLSLIVGDFEVAGRIVSLVSGVSLVAVVYLLGRQLFNERAAILCGLLAAVHPVLVALSVSVFSESLAMALMILGVYCGVETMRTRSLGWAVFAGASFGLGYWVRPELLLFTGLVSATCFLWRYVRDRRWRPALLEGMLPLLTAVLIAVPLMIYLSSIAGHFRWEGKSAINEITNERMRAGMTYAEASRGLGLRDEPEPPYEGGPFLTADQRVFLRNPRARLSDHVRQVLEAAPTRAWAAVRKIGGAQFLGSPVILIFALVGFAASGWWRRHWGGGILLASLGLLQCAMLLAIEHHFGRFFLPLALMLTPWAGAGIDTLCTCGARLLHGKPGVTGFAFIITLFGVIVVVIISVFMYAPASRVHELWETRDVTAKHAGVWIREENNNGETNKGRAQSIPRLMGFSSAIAFYADAALSYPPYADPARALAYIRRRSPDYIALRSSEGSWAPYTLAWLENGIPDSCAVPAFEDRLSTDEFVRVWRWSCR